MAPPPVPPKAHHLPVIVSAVRHSPVTPAQHVVKIRINSSCEPPAQSVSASNAVRICIGPHDMILKGHQGSPPYFFYNQLPSGQSSPSDTLDSGTCSDLDGSTPPPLPKKKGANSGAEAESDDDISCDSLNSSELEEQPKDKAMPEVVLQDIRERSARLSLVEQRTYEEREQCQEPQQEVDPDSFYRFHLNERGVEPPAPHGDGEDNFAGCKGYQEGDPVSATIRSSKGTIRGVKNRVRAGIATFLKMHETKSWQEKEAGQVVVYTTTMGIVRATAQRCLKVRHILRTQLVKFEERDLFMSREAQSELRSRMVGDPHVPLPQVFVEGRHLGDADTVDRLNESGELRRILKPYKSPDACNTCQVCGGYRLLPCAVCNGSKKSVHRNHFTTELVALKCMNCDEVGLVKCYAC